MGRKLAFQMRTYVIRSCVVRCNGKCVCVCVVQVTHARTHVVCSSEPTDRVVCVCVVDMETRAKLQHGAQLAVVVIVHRCDPRQGGLLGCARLNASTGVPFDGADAVN